MYARGVGIEWAKEGEKDAPAVDKRRPRSKNSIISADARTSLGFPGADNGALFEASFRARAKKEPSSVVFRLSPFSSGSSCSRVRSLPYTVEREFKGSRGRAKDRRREGNNRQVVASEDEGRDPR